MDQHNEVMDRDVALYRRYGVAPTLGLGIDTATRFTLSFFKEIENNLPDYGIPFIDGAPAHVDRSNYYGLVNYDRTRTNTNIGTLRFEHDFSESLTVSDNLRYANYCFDYLVDGPFLGNDFVAPPPPGTPYADIEVSRDQPSSAGTITLLINRSDVTGRFNVLGFNNTLTTGLEVSKEVSRVHRYENGLDDIAPTPLLSPDPFNIPPTPLLVYATPQGEGRDVSVYALDSVALGAGWDVDCAKQSTRCGEPLDGT